MVINSTIQKSSTPNLITFYLIDSDINSGIIYGTYHAEKGMTWAEFVNSSYNDGTISISSNTVKTTYECTSPSTYGAVSPNEFIRDNVSYTISLYTVFDTSKFVPMVLSCGEGSNTESIILEQSIEEISKKYSYIYVSSVCGYLDEFSENIVLSLYIDLDGMYGDALVWNRSTANSFITDVEFISNENVICVNDGIFSSYFNYFIIGQY